MRARRRWAGSLEKGRVATAFTMAGLPPAIPPGLRAVSVRLLHDPDEEGRIWIVLSPHILESAPIAYTIDGIRRFAQRQVANFPFRFHPSFSLVITYCAEES